MSFTWRPRRPPALLVSSSQILAPSSACLPLAARPPVNAMLKPILIGSLLCALAEATNIAPAAKVTATPANHANVRDFRCCTMIFLPMGFAFLMANNDSARRNGPPACSAKLPAKRPSQCGLSRRENKARFFDHAVQSIPHVGRLLGLKFGLLVGVDHSPTSAGGCPQPRLDAFDHNGFDLTSPAAAKRRSPVIFRRGKAGSALLQRRKLNHNEPLEFVRTFHDLETPATRQHPAAEFGDDGGHQIGVFLVLDRIVDFRTRNPIGRHG